MLQKFKHWAWSERFCGSCSCDLFSKTRFEKSDFLKKEAFEILLTWITQQKISGVLRT